MEQVALSKIADEADIQALFEGMYQFIHKYGYKNVSVSGYADPSGGTLSLTAGDGAGSSYTVSGRWTNAAAPAPAVEVHK